MIMNTNKIAFAVGSLVIATLGAVSVGCGGAHLSQLKEAAEADLQCPKSRVHILNSGKTRDVEACGQRATYHYEDGDWRMIARSGGAPAGAAGQPVMKSAPGVAPAQPAPVMTPPSTPSQPPGTPSQPPPSAPAPGNKQI